MKDNILGHKYLYLRNSKPKSSTWWANFLYSVLKWFNRWNFITPWHIAVNVRTFASRSGFVSEISFAYCELYIANVYCYHQNYFIINLRVLLNELNLSNINIMSSPYSIKRVSLTFCIKSFYQMFLIDPVMNPSKLHLSVCKHTH